MKHALYSIALLLLAASPAFAQEATQWTMLKEKSTLSFAALYGKDTIEGSFPGFSAEIAFSPDALKESHIAVTIPVADFVADDYDAKEYLPEEEWLDTEHYKAARFTSDTITQTGENTYQASGVLTIKDISHPLTLPFTLTLSQDGTHAFAEGQTALFRRDYKIGQGEWEDTTLLADKVVLRFHVEASRVMQP